MDQRAIIDVICKTGIENLSPEIGALLGQDLTCDDIKLHLITKETLFNNPERSPTALTRLEISGDKEGNCFLLTSINTAIILGGTLIMLPEDMIEENVQAGKLDGELNDAFGEVANIIAGVFTQAFVDKYSGSLRFIKKSVEELMPTKIEVASSEPFPPGSYYVASCHMAVAEQDLGILEFVVPAAAFDLEEAEAEASTDAEAEAAPAAPEATQEPPAEQPEPVAEPATTPAAEPVAEATPAAAPRPAFADAKKLTDVVFNATISQIGEEIGALLGQDLVCDDIQLVMTSKADFFANHCSDKVTMANMQVSGDKDGNGYLFTRIPDAIILGGTLIMLPEEQIEEQLAKQQYDGEVEDAFGEVANILAGGLTQVFLDRYPKQLRFVRTESATVAPTKLDPASDDPFPEGDYYLASFAIGMEGFELERFWLLFPAAVFDLDGYQQDPAAATAAQSTETGTASDSGQAAEQPAAAQAVAGAGSGETAASQPAVAAPAPSGPPLVLVISEKSEDAQTFTEVLSTAEYATKVISFQEDIKAPFQQHQVLGAILIMSQVNEKGFATAIKLQSTGQSLPPLIFAGPEWTRSTVLRAVKYGARDILVMPASGDEIEEKISQHFRKAS